MRSYNFFYDKGIFFPVEKNSTCHSTIAYVEPHGEM